MKETMIRHLNNNITAFEQSIGDISLDNGKISTSDKIIKLINENPYHSTKSLAGSIGISVKGVEKQLAKLKSQGRIRRIGPDKGGLWEVTADK